MSEIKDIRAVSDIVASATAAATFAIVAYCHHGSINHRSTWDRQHFFLPILFILFPEIYICQVVMNSILVIQRRVSMRKLGVAMNDEGFWYYVSSILDIHSKDREFAPGAVWIGGPSGGHAQKSEGMWRLATLNPGRLTRNNKYDLDGFRKSPFIGRVFVTVLLLYQGVSASYIYFKRVSSIRNATLSLDHFTGMYAVCGSIMLM